MTNAIEEATAAIKQFAAREIDLIREQITKREELVVVEATAGDQYLESSTTGGVDAVLRIQAEIAAINRAIGSCRQKRLQAIQAKLDAEVQELRRRAADSRKQAAAIQSKTAPLLASLEEIEGVDHVPQGMAQSASAASMSRLLDGQAAEMERRGAPINGHVHVDGTFTNDELALAVVSDSSIGPSASEILGWIQTRDPAVREDTVPRSARISWSNGLIDQASYLGALPQPRAVAPQEEAPPPANSQLRTPSQFFGVAARPVQQENRG